jgi:hypothetical protein
MRSKSTPTPHFENVSHLRTLPIIKHANNVIMNQKIFNVLQWVKHNMNLNIHRSQDVGREVKLNILPNVKEL